MIFFQWRYVIYTALLGVPLVVHRFLYRQDSRRWWRAVLMILAVPFGLLGSLLLCLDLLPTGCNSHSAPILSPDRSMAARVETLDGGALGGTSAVVVYRRGGFNSVVVFSGFWGEVTPERIRWTGPRRLEVLYADPYEAFCVPAAWIELECRLVPTLGAEKGQPVK